MITSERSEYIRDLKATDLNSPRPAGHHPRVAICFFGITRNLRQFALESIRNQLLRPVASIDSSYRRFAHFNVTEQICNPRTKELNVPIERFEYRYLECDLTAETDQDVLDASPELERQFAELKSFGDSWDDDFGSLRNCVRQGHSLQKVTNLLVSSGEHFDLVIFSRADLKFLQMKLPPVDSGTLYTPWFDKYRGLNDRFALGDQKTMTLYGQRYAFALQYCQETGNAFHSECFLKWFAAKQELRTRDLTGVEFCRARANGRIICPKLNSTAKLKYRLKRLVGAFR